MFEKHWRWWCAGVFALTALLHLAPVENYLDNDDAWNYVLESQMFLDGEGSAWVSGDRYFARQNLFRIIPSLSFVTRYGLFGLAMPAWHIPSILLHALNALLLILLARRLGLGRFTAIVSGALFGLSPLHSHTVSWIGGSFDLFCGAFFLGALLAFSHRRTALGLLMTAGAMMSKESGIMIGPVLALYVLFFESNEGLKHAVKRLWPYALVCICVTGLRVLQVAAVGSIDEAGLPARSIGIDWTSLFVVGPQTLLHSISCGLYSVLELDPDIFSLLFGGLLLIAAAVGFRRNTLSGKALFFSVTAAFLFLVPILMLVELGSHMPLAEILRNERYLYLPQLAGAVVLPMALFGIGEKVGKLALISAPLVLAASSVFAAGNVLTLSLPDSPVRAVATKIMKTPPVAGTRVYVLANTYDEATFRFLMSRWLQQKTGATFHYVQRGSWRILERDPARVDGLDFIDFYIREAGEPFGTATPKKDDLMMLFRNGGPDGKHTLEKIGWANLQPPQVATPKALQATWTGQTPQFQVRAQVGAQGQVRFKCHKRPDRPGGYHHRPLVDAEVRGIKSRRVRGFKVTYTASERRPHPGDRKYAHGYAELHWRGDSADPDLEFVSFPILASRTPRTIEIPLWFDPVWSRSGRIQSIGFHALDDVGQFTLHRIEAIYQD